MALFATDPGPYVHSSHNVAGMMRTVMLALAPAIAALFWLFGIGILLNCLIACLSCWLFEYAMLKLRDKPLRPTLYDGSALLTGLLIGVCLPPAVPFWLPFIAALFAVVFAKHLYGGLGHNLFNPAMAGYAVLLVSFPSYMGYWPPPDLSGLNDSLLSLGDTLALQTGRLTPFDAVSSATPLDTLKTGLNNMQMLPEIQTGAAFDGFGPRGWVWVNLLALAGGIWLLLRGVISWRIPVGVVAGLGIPALLAWLGDAGVNPSPWLHWVSGGTLLGVFFFATDPVSSAATPRGQLIYGAGIGILTWVIRTWGAYPDGFAFAVLLMNLAVPLIDRYTPTKIYGHPP